MKDPHTRVEDYDKGFINDTITGTLAKGDIILAMIERRGNSASDTYGATWKLLEYRITFA